MTLSNLVKIFAASTLLVGGFAIWYWARCRKRLGKVIQLDSLSKAEIHIIMTAEEWAYCFPQLYQDAEKTKVIGVDCEWVMKHPVAMLQIATQSGYCVLVRLCYLKSNIPHSLKCLLADKRIFKVGVAINDDAKKLLRDYDLHMNGCIDLRHVLQRVYGIYKCRSWGLQGLARCVLGLELCKDVKLRCGNWEAPQLSSKQIDYAAMDAIVAVDILAHLVQAKITGVNPRLHQQGACTLPLDKFLSATRSLCQGLMDMHYNRKASHNRVKMRNLHEKTKKQSGDAYSVRKRPLWDNCELLAPDGQLLCTCDSRKAAWYISKGLGEKISSEPLVVKLKFEPSGRPRSERNYYLQFKENTCVVCGDTSKYARKFIVPQEYRKYFPNLLKEHTSHDVLLMCPSCHRLSSDYDALLRIQLAHECNAPLDSGENSRMYQDHDLQQVQSAGRALKLNREKIPEARIQQLENILSEFYGVCEITEDIITRAAHLDIKQVKENYISHGKLVVDYMAQNGGLLAFQARWRHHFMETMKPRFLPAYWSVDYVPENWNAESQNGSDDEEDKYAHDEKEVKEVTDDNDGDNDENCWSDAEGVESEDYE